MKREKKKKKRTLYEPYIHIVTSIKESTIYAKRVKDGKVKCRDASKVKPLRTTRLAEINDEKFLLFKVTLENLEKQI